MKKIDKLRQKYKDIPGERFFEELFTNNEYEPARNVKCNVVLDIGALAGEFCAYMYDKADIIYALEPFTPYFNELSDNVHEFNLTKIKPFKLALGDRNGKQWYKEEFRGGGRLIDTEGTEQVEVKTLAEFMKSENIDHINVLKIDIEGGEKAVFSASDFDEVAGKIDFIIGEHQSEMSKIERHGFKLKESWKNNLIYTRT